MAQHEEQQLPLINLNSFGVELRASGLVVAPDAGRNSRVPLGSHRLSKTG
jgi:hypothetical protein